MFEALGCRPSRLSTAVGWRKSSRGSAVARSGVGSTKCRTRSISACCASQSTGCAISFRAPDLSANRLLELSAAAEHYAELARAVPDLGGHDLALLPDAFTRADAALDRPSVVFAYTIKAWRLPTQGHPGNHSALLTDQQWEQLADDLDANLADPWAPFAQSTPEDRLCRVAAERLQRPPIYQASRRDPSRLRTTRDVHVINTAGVRPLLPRTLAQRSRGRQTHCHRQPRRSHLDDNLRRLDQQGRDLAHRRPNRLVRGRSRDAAALAAEPERPTHRTRHRRRKPRRATRRTGRNLVARRCVTTPNRNSLRPVRQPRARAIVLRHYAGGQSILVGTPSGITLAPEAARINRSSRPRSPRSAPLHRLGAHLCTRPRMDASVRTFTPGTPRRHILILPALNPSIHQTLAEVPNDPAARERRRRGAVGGGCCLLSPRVSLRWR